MDSSRKNPSGELALAPSKGKAHAPARRVRTISMKGTARFARVRPHGDRRRNFLRRHLLRGLDELRRQQTRTDPPESGAELDVRL